MTFSSGLVSLVATVGGLTPVQTRQLSLWPAGDAPRPVGEAIDRLAARHRTALFFRPVPAEAFHPLPERRFALQALAPAAAGP